MLRQLEQAAEVLRLDEEAEHWSVVRSRVRAAFLDEWVTPNGRLANETQTACALAICFGLLDDEQSVRAGQRLADLVTAAGFHISTGFAGTPWLLHVLSQSGHGDFAYRLLDQTTPP